VPVLTLTSNKVAFRQLLISRACWPLLIDQRGSDEELVTLGVGHAKEKGWIETDDWVVVVSGTEGIQGSAHTLKIIRVR
jgi:pyruvate kinase